MRLIDNEGFVLGTINIIDVLVILLVLAVAAAGVALVTASPEPNPTQSITVRTTPQPDYVIEAIPTGPVPTDDIVVVNRKTIDGEVDNRTVAVLQIVLEVSLQDSVSMFQYERLYIGRSLRLDLGTTIVDGVVIDMEPVDT